MGCRIAHIAPCAILRIKLLHDIPVGLVDDGHIDGFEVYLCCFLIAVAHAVTNDVERHSHLSGYRGPGVTGDVHRQFMVYLRHLSYCLQRLVDKCLHMAVLIALLAVE